MFDKRQRSKQSHTSKGLFCQEIRRPEHKTEEKPSAPVVCVGFSITRVIVVGFDSMRGVFFLRVCDLDRLCSGRQEM